MLEALLKELRQHLTQMGVQNRATGGLVTNQFRRFSTGDQFAAIQHRNAITATFGFVQVVRGQQNRVAFFAQVEQRAEQRISAGRVERCGRFIEQQDGGVVQQCNRQVQALFHATGVGADAVGAPVG